MNGNNPKGYIKICSQWLQRLWGAKTPLDLNTFTLLFDDCGAMDGDGGYIEMGSKEPKWKTALDFMEWFGA